MAPREPILVMLVRWEQPGRPRYLGLDLGSGERVHELAAPDDPGPDLAGAILCGEDVPLAAGPGGGLLIPGWVFWSLLDPLGAAWPDHDPFADRHEAEAFLRAQRERAHRRLRWWAEAGRREGGALRGLLHGYRPDLVPLLDWLDGHAASAVPETPAPNASGASGTGAADPLPTPDPAAIAAWMNSPTGLGAVYGEGFAPRPEQAAMARDVAGALAAGRPLVIEAGTGVGKTLAYLVPLLAAVAATEGRGVVATHTRTLQSQLLEQDLPRLRGLLPRVRWALLMGRRNYLCLRQRRAFLTRPLETLTDALKTAALRMWLRATGEGLREELVGHPLLDEELPELFDSPEPCIPGECYEGHDCFVQEARRRARAADLLVVNHSLLMHDLQRQRTILGEYAYLVVDEAHRLPQVTLDTHALVVGRWRLEEIGELLGGWGPAGGMPRRPALIAQRLEAMGKDAGAAARAAGDFGRLARECAPLFRAWWSALGEDLAPVLEGEGRRGRARVRDKHDLLRTSRAAAEDLLARLAEAQLAGARLMSLAGDLEGASEAVLDDLALAGQAVVLLERLLNDVRFLSHDADERWVTWAEPGPRGGLRALGATLIEAGDLLREYWLSCGLQPVMTSATLAVGDDFTHMLGELGLSRRRPQALATTSPSPFDFHRQVLVLTPTRFLAPDAPDFGREVGRAVAGVMRAVGRKTMALFTSYRHLSEAAEVLREEGIVPPGERTEGTGGTVLLQQTPGTPAGPLAAAFRRRRDAVLLGTASFWEGVDFPGDDLEVLVVTKLPFLVPSDPWVQARCDLITARGENPFMDFMVRDAVLRLKQGFGRLIRRPGDRGVVIILDTRLHTKRYGATFLADMPVIPRGFGDLQELEAKVREFFLAD